MFVSIGRKYDAFCPKSEIYDAVIGKQSVFFVSSKVRQLEEVALVSRGQALPWEELCALQESNQTVFVKVVKVGGTNKDNNWAVVEFVEGLAIKGFRGFISPAELRVQGALALEGKLIPAVVSKLDPQEGGKHGLIHLSHVKVFRKNDEATANMVTPGEQVEARVLKFIKAQKNDTHPSVLVELVKDGLSIQGMIHKTEVTGYPKLKADEVLSVGDAVKAHVFRYSAANKGFAISLRAEEKAKFYSEVEDGMILQVRLAARIFLYWAAAAKIQLLKALHSQ